MTSEPVELSSQLSPVMLEAIDWMICLDSGQETEQDRQKFQEWLSADASHLHAWQQIQQGLDQPFQQLQEDSVQAQVPLPVITHTVLGRKARNSSYILGSAFFLIITFTIGVFWLEQTRPLSFWRADYYTRTAEVKSFTLDDGSRITLNAHSAIRVDYHANQRNIYLLEGALIADVEADKTRPFVVSTQQAKMKALGTIFMVEQHDQYSDLAVLEHAVEARQRIVGEKQAIRLYDDQILSLSDSAQTLASWQQGVLEVQDQSLEQLVKSIQPYRTGKILLSERVKHLKVYGVFYLEDTDKILDILTSTQPVRIHRMGAKWVYIDLKEN